MVNGFLTAPFPTVNGLPQGSALSCTQWVVLLQPAVAHLNQLRSAGALPGSRSRQAEHLPLCLLVQTTQSRTCRTRLWTALR